MKCIDCETNMIGSIPNHLQAAGRCRKCNKIYVAKIAIIAEKTKKAVEEHEEKRTIVRAGAHSRVYLNEDSDRVRRWMSRKIRGEIM